MFLERWRWRRLQPKWIARVKGMETVIHGDGRLFVVQGLTKHNKPRPRDVWPAKAISVYEVDSRTGALYRLDGSTQGVEGTADIGAALDIGTGLCTASRLYVNYGNRVVGWDSQRGLSGHQYRSVEDARVVESPLEENGSLVCLWELAHRGGARVSRDDGGPGSFRTSEVLEGEPYFPMLWAGASVLVATRGPGQPEPAAERARLYLLDARTLQVEASAEVPTIGFGKQALLVECGQVFYGWWRRIQAEPDGEFHELAPKESAAKGEAKVTGMQHLGIQDRPWLSCHTVQDLRPVKSWRLMGECRYLTSVPGRPAIIVTANPGVFDTSVEVLVNSRPRPVAVGAWAGDAVCSPEILNGRSHWLTNIAAASWDEAMEQAKTGEEPLPRRLHDTEVHMLDFSTGEHRVLALTLGEEGRRLFLLGELTIIQTGTALIATTSDDLWDAADSVRSETLAGVARALEFAGGPAPLKGALLSGPLQEEWGYQHEDGTLHEMVDDLIECPTAFWAGMPSDRLKAIAAITKDLVRSVLTHWPDTIALQAQSCPDEFFRQARAVDPRVDTPFGRLGTNRSLADRILTWRQQAEATAEVLPPGAAEGIARFLLHEHIRRCINNLTVDDVVFGWRKRRLIDLRLANQLTPALKVTLAWYSLENLEPRLAERFLKEFVTRWPEGAPAWEGDVRQYLEFLHDSARWGLLCQPTRNSLPEAVCRAWSSALNPRRRAVFISYSHRHEGVAQGVAAGLKQYGLRVALDRWEIGADSDDRTVETWIAEAMISAEVKIFLLSSEALLSGWVNREIEWELRLLGVRRSMSLPYLLIADESTPLSLDSYPRGRVVRVADLEGRDRAAVLQELALRIVLDGVLQFQTARDGVLLGLPN